ncbi:Telomere repeat-binding protein 6 [Quillaja saponaria]|uniref:Telomere repeat-binding protein 6 n=1 Tax=Quillaja saponaria TaxID=32244 RepID=A0AAD7Q8M5_QUISA|nr:Telomere repeat-binding protein 6 [Quillaja saponaria]
MTEENINRMWTPSEVIKLVDGISEYGVGRWTDIKRDKWRNLLRSSFAKLSKKEVEQKQENTSRLLPNSVLHRVHELAKIHPYPRGYSSKKSCVGEVASPAVLTESKGVPISLGKRNVRRKKSP